MQLELFFFFSFKAKYRNLNSECVQFIYSLLLLYFKISNLSIHSPTSGPLHLLFPLPRMSFHQIPTWFPPSFQFRICSNVTLSEIFALSTLNEIAPVLLQVSFYPFAILHIWWLLCPTKCKLLLWSKCWRPSRIHMLKPTAQCDGIRKQRALGGDEAMKI